MIRIYTLIIAFSIRSIFMFGNVPTEVQKALEKAGKNKASLERVLNKYKIKNEKEKYLAACYLIKNMQWHKQYASVPVYDKNLDKATIKSDSIYYSLVNGCSNEEQNSNEFKKTLKKKIDELHEQIKNYTYELPKIDYSYINDIEALNGDFIENQIEHAFKLRKEVKRVKSLSFDDFCEYILPYRVVGNYPFVYPTQKYATLFGKYLKPKESETVSDVISKYNTTADILKLFSGKYPYKINVGFPSFFYYGLLDCVDIVNYGASTLRMLGYPLAVEYNIAYKLWQGRHFHVSTLDEQGRWVSFTPEGDLPTYKNPDFIVDLNFYRQHFGIQKNNPYSLKGEKELVPEDLNDPCIEDVTNLYLKTVKMKIPCNIETENKLVYLASFISTSGLVPVTWGIYDKNKNLASFENVVTDNLYFPVYYNTVGRIRGFGKPFWIYPDSTSANGYKAEYIGTPTNKNVNTVLIRKFPRKPKMEEYAMKAIGTVLLASEDKTFKKADTLGVIISKPDDKWELMKLSNKKPYRFYRVQSAKEDGHIRLAEVQFLTDSTYHYENTTKYNNKPNKYLRLLDEPLEKSKWKTEYDGNVQTAPDAYPNITFSLYEPQVVTGLRYIVKNEDNRIKEQDLYQLYEWNGKEWKMLCMKRGTVSGLKAEFLKVGTLYWLKDISSGLEELPFTVDVQGRQIFPHKNLMIKLKERM